MNFYKGKFGAIGHKSLERSVAICGLYLLINKISAICDLAYVCIFCFYWLFHYLNIFLQMNY